MNGMRFTMTNKTVLLSGGTSGVGKATAIGLARQGAKVVILSRSGASGRQALADIAHATGNDRGEVLVADLSLQSSIREACTAFKRQHDRLDVLAHLGGAIYWDKQVTAEGVERMFAVNVLSHFVLTRELTELLKESRPSRIVTVGGNPRFLKKPHIDFEDIQLLNRFSGMRAATQAMNARILLAFEWAKRFEETGAASVAFHPGWVKSGLTRHSPWYLRMMAPLLNARASEDCESGVYAASAMEIDEANGVFLDDRMKALPIRDHYDPEAGPALWRICEELTRA
ncbi:SDR family NAD(P)-dependent oxidoreductase [Paenibacillus lycopersici]|uniref:SDR family NAD(P)-dependent oxidoreductase n=1 Tax=Paenibacillus lycopersici TaxID=2704462 RepID=A0A6C0FXY6_9BACL|nr:SDR family NAD(P)-dependent oxidoreductase [Paenibacillus lycopersici]QHT59060.1 SDR family NAD(P)-dependent oxidoreductase [Paenibacillus lycopersici]